MVEDPSLAVLDARYRMLARAQILTPLVQKRDFCAGK
jgi:hypothetical protein